jgi:hypothetical protein
MESMTYRKRFLGYPRGPSHVGRWRRTCKQRDHALAHWDLEGGRAVSFTAASTTGRLGDKPFFFFSVRAREVRLGAFSLGMLKIWNWSN